MIWDAALSVLLHLGIALIIGVSWLQATGPRAMPGTWMQAYLQAGPAEPDASGTAPKHPVLPITHTSAAHPAAAAARPAADIDPSQAAALTAVAKSPDATAGDLSEPGLPAQAESASSDRAAVLATAADSRAETPTRTHSAQNESPPAEVSPRLATIADSGGQPPTSADSNPAEPLPLAVSASQQAMLARRLAELAHSLRDNDLTPLLRSWRHAGRQYTALLTRQPNVGETDIERVAVEITTEEAGKHLRTSLQMKRLPFSYFTQLVDKWDAEVQFHDDEIVGRFHSNSEFVVGYDSLAAPRFIGKVTTTAARAFATGNTSGSKRASELFHEGTQTHASRITFPARLQPLVADHAARTSEVRTFASDTRITFYADGSYGWQALGSDVPEQREPIATAPSYIAGAPRAAILVHGTVNGRVMVYSPKLIVIEGDLVYAHDPRGTPGSDDYMALVSDNDIEIAPPSVTGPGDLRIDAAVYARGRFTVADGNVRGHATLFVYGSLIAGSVSASEPRYATRVAFDPRFEHVRPPSFPMTDRYELETWDSHWQRVETDSP